MTIKYKSINSKSKIKALNLKGKMSKSMACQNIITPRISATKNHIKPPKNGLGPLYIKITYYSVWKGSKICQIDVK